MINEKDETKRKRWNCTHEKTMENGMYHAPCAVNGHITASLQLVKCSRSDTHLSQNA